MLPWVSLALNFYLLDVRPFWLATALVVANNAALFVSTRGGASIGSSPAEAGRADEGRRTAIRVALVAFVAFALLIAAARSWVTQILVFPHDPQRADMLVVIQLGIRRLLQGHTPYAMYRVPWDATLPYGPVMWAPMIVPYLWHADIRFVTVLGALFVPAACAGAALAAARRARVASIAGPLLLLAAIAFSVDIRSFMSIGHTPAYWPLLPLFAWTLHRRRWIAAAAVCGLLIVARTTMVSLVPALAIAVWQRDRARAGATAGVLAASVALPLAPFAIADPSSFVYAFYGSYQHVIKGFVWTATTWAQQTVGVTGPLLARGWQAAVEPVQAIAMAAVTLATWVRLRRGDDPTWWSAIGLLTFSMTTIWPVVYVYFDVFLLLASAALVAEAPRSESAAAWWLRRLAVAAAVLTVTTMAIVPRRASIDVGRADARPWLYAGFSGDERDGDRTFAWVDGRSAKTLVPSILRRDAIIAIECEPYLVGSGRQRVTATLNGVLLGTADASDGWQRLTFDAPARAWLIGANELDLFMASAASPRDAGEGGDARHLSIAIDRIDVTSRVR